jgi:hypothetical protein
MQTPPNRTAQRLNAPTLRATKLPAHIVLPMLGRLRKHKAVPMMPALTNVQLADIELDGELKKLRSFGLIS